MCLCLVSHMALEWPYPGTIFLEQGLYSLENIMVQLPARLFFTFLHSALFFIFVPGQEDPLEENMAPHYSILAWRIPRTEEPGGLQSIRLQRVRHD